jgi:hypothetical protein
MARARNIKPSFFQNEELGELFPIERLAFIGMWTIADFKGCIELRPKRLKVQLLPYDECDFESIVNNLDKSGFISIYSVQGQRYIKIINFEKHQNPHKNERESGSEIPDIFDRDDLSNKISGLENIENNRDKNGTTHADSLFPLPDSLNADSLIPSSLIPSVALPENSGSSQKNETELQIACRHTWTSYSNAYFEKYQTEPVRNAKVSSQVKDFVKRIGYEESPHVAAWFLNHTSAFYVQSGHVFGSLAKDAEKLRTEWATGKSMNANRARQVERAGSMVDVVNEIINERAAA